jgi:hypothetical protein
MCVSRPILLTRLSHLLFQSFCWITIWPSVRLFKPCRSISSGLPGSRGPFLSLQVDISRTILPLKKVGKVTAQTFVKLISVVCRRLVTNKQHGGDKSSAVSWWDPVIFPMVPHIIRHRVVTWTPNPLVIGAYLQRSLYFWVDLAFCHTASWWPKRTHRICFESWSLFRPECEYIS